MMEALWRVGKNGVPVDIDSFLWASPFFDSAGAGWVGLFISAERVDCDGI